MFVLRLTNSSVAWLPLAQSNPHRLLCRRMAVSDEIAALPNLSGLGNLRSLHQAMARDDSAQLQALVKQYTDPATTFAQRDALLNDILYHWAGVQDVDQINRYSRCSNSRALHWRLRLLLRRASSKHQLQGV